MFPIGQSLTDDAATLLVNAFITSKIDNTVAPFFTVSLAAYNIHKLQLVQSIVARLNVNGCYDHFTSSLVADRTTCYLQTVIEL